MDTLKPIETVYRGYRFRSRLEARWAVFFDALDIAWEYEAEGYDCGAAGWYLPDFCIRDPSNPIVNVFVEVKDSDFSPAQIPINVYLAGKVSKGSRGDDDPMANYEWRRSIAEERFLGHKHEFYANQKEYTTIAPGIRYVGPHFADNHNCYITHERALEQILRADVLFAWIDSPDAFGTFAEIGYARGAGKDVYVGFSNTVDYKDMWFLGEMAFARGVYKTAKEAFYDLVPLYVENISNDEKKVIELSIRSKKEVVIVMGDPFSGTARTYRDGLGSGRQQAIKLFNYWNVLDENFAKIAATKARQSRFEHDARSYLRQLLDS